MPQLVDGKWEKGDVAASEMKGGAFHREPTSFRNWITPDGTPGPDGQPGLPAEAGRYKLFVSYLCPWASRTLMMRKLKGLEDIIALAVSEPELGENGWTYPEPQNAGPRVGKIRYQYELYAASDPHYTGKVSVPVLWDLREGRIVNNEFRRYPAYPQHGLRPPDRQRPRFLPCTAARGNRPLERPDLRQGQQRRLPCRLRQDAGCL